MPRKEIRHLLEEWGEPKVRQMLADGDRILGDVDSPYQHEVLLWLADKAEARLAARSALTLRRVVPDWWIQTSWWASGIFATGAVWYFLSMREYCISVATGIAAVMLAIFAIILHRKKDALQSNAASVPQAPAEKDKLVTSTWWGASDLQKEYVKRGFNHFAWSNAERVAEHEQQGYEIVYLDDLAANVRYRIINKSKQVLIAKHNV